MWVSLVASGLPASRLILPARLREAIEADSIILRYGASELLVPLGAPVRRGPSGASPKRPAQITIPLEVVQALHIQTEPTYRVRVGGGRLEIGPVVGLLLGPRNHWYDHDYLSREPERITDVYPRTGGLFCAFAGRNISFSGRCAHGLFYHPGEQKWRFGAVPLPTVIHRRSFHHPDSLIEQLRQVPGMQMFNSRRFNKWEMYEILRRDAVFQRYLPATGLVTGSGPVLELLERHETVILKPAGLSRGRGIVFLQRAGNGFQLVDCRNGGQPVRVELSASALETFLARELVPYLYICQQRIDLATIDGAPFDIRMVMQRDPVGRWRCSGIEVRHAARGNLITNIALGGRALLLDEALRLAFPAGVDLNTVRQSLLELCFRLCERLDLTGEHFGELGLDAALDSSGRPWFIEANVLPTYKGFQIIDPRTHRDLLAAPLRYASFLAGFGEPSGEGRSSTPGEDHGKELSSRRAA